jgi:hypothetical protein
MKQDRDTKIGERAKAIVKAKASMEALRKAQAAPKRPMPKEPTTGGSGTVPLTPERKEFLKEMAKRDAKPGMAKGGKMASCGLKNGGKAKSFAATKFGAAMMKKSADTKGRAMVKKADGGKCYAKGGKVKKMAVGGMSTTPSTAPKWAASNTTARATTPTTPAANTAAPAASNTAPPAANTAAPAASNTAPPAANTAAPAPYKPVTPLQNVQNFIDRKYSSATPNLDKSAKSGSNETTRMAAGKDPASGPNTAATKSTFDRNQSLRDFNAVARTFLNQGVSNKELIQAQGQLRKLQMDNRSTPAQHQAAMQSIIARMNSLVPKRAAKGGSMKAAKKFASGGLVGGHKAANGIAKKGLTKGTQVKMNKGGACYAKGGSVRGIDGIATKGKTRCKGARK